MFVIHYGCLLYCTYICLGISSINCLWAKWWLSKVSSCWKDWQPEWKLINYGCRVDVISGMFWSVCLLLCVSYTTKEIKTALSCKSSLCAVRHFFVLIYCSVQNICIGCEGSYQHACLWHVLHVAYLEENCCLVFIHQSCLYMRHCFVLVYKVNSTFITLSPSLFAPYLCILIKLLFYLLFRAR